MSAQQVLLQGIAQLGLVIDEDKRQKLLAYVQMISKWNKVHNLTAIRDEVSMMTLHILDSLVTLPLIQQDEHILDVGSGAGLPGIVIAICKPDVQVTVIDASQKKASFMRQVKAELDLQNLTVLAGRVEQQMIATPFDSIISRAFSDLKTFISLTQELLKKQGRWLAMKGQVPQEEIDALTAAMGITIDAIIPLQVPGLDAERHILIIKHI